MDSLRKSRVVLLVVLLAPSIQAQGRRPPSYGQLDQDSGGYNYDKPMVQLELPTTPKAKETSTTETPAPYPPTTQAPDPPPTDTPSTDAPDPPPTDPPTTEALDPPPTEPPPPPPTVFPPRTSICVLMTAAGMMTSEISGGVFITQEIKGGPVVLSGTIQGLDPGLHAFHLHRDAAVGGDCAAAGPHFNPFNSTHGGPMDLKRHAGDFGNIEANELGVAFVSIVAPGLMLAVETGGSLGVIGRSLVIHEKPDDLGLGGDDESLTTGNTGARLACCVIKNLANATSP
ncbi:superoxide dismutase [Cu-Zn]-like [Hetaerina americana]|uniref:superoxide dismutase [Cu-Zn]-like n=1 Tax=Hetaerina americana TaxID=62018 RepID=UPI003A7F23A7